LGSAAGYGNSFPLDREMTTQLLGFENLSVNSIYAQMGRGKVERTLAFALGSVAATLSKFAMDVCLYANQDFKFIKLADEFTTGSSIMPHKKNPDVFELIRAKCNKIQGAFGEIQLVTNNLPSGYFRDMQMVKEIIFPAIFDLKQCLEICTLAIQNVAVNKEIIYQDKYKYVFSVEEVNKLVLQGVPFRDAYKTVGLKIENGEFEPNHELNHVHLGSIGNLGNEIIKQKFDATLNKFPFSKVKEALKNLVK
jgi:argininosuccinate lyase